MRRLAICFLVAACALLAQPPTAELLWPKGAPGALGAAPEDQPSLAPFVLAKGSGAGTAVIVCPGGGYQHLSMDKEGYQVAQWLNSIGVSAFVLQYRLGPRYHYPNELLTWMFHPRTTLITTAMAYMLMPLISTVMNANEIEDTA